MIYSAASRWYVRFSLRCKSFSLLYVIIWLLWNFFYITSWGWILRSAKNILFLKTWRKFLLPLRWTCKLSAKVFLYLVTIFLNLPLYSLKKIRLFSFFPLSFIQSYYWRLPVVAETSLYSFLHYIAVHRSIKVLVFDAIRSKE